MRSVTGGHGDIDDRVGGCDQLVSRSFQQHAAPQRTGCLAGRRPNQVVAVETGEMQLRCEIFAGQVHDIQVRAESLDEAGEGVAAGVHHFSLPGGMRDRLIGLVVFAARKLKRSGKMPPRALPL